VKPSSTKQSEGAVAPEAMIKMSSIFKIYGSGNTQVKALDGVNLQIQPGEFISVIGPSGSGKSTCMNVLGCLDVPTAGSYRFWGMEVGNLTPDQLALLRRHYIGFVFQSFNLLARTNAAENVELPLIYKGVPRSERRAMAMRALASVGLGDRASHTPSELSGGQQQRVAVARALVTEPSLLLADEPTGNLDTTTTHEIMALLTRLNREQGRTIVMVTHEPNVAQFTDRVIKFVDGKIVADGPPAEVFGTREALL
jgi:putative ABC transport system ATP-binding protein